MLLHTANICLEEEKNPTTLQKCYWEQTQNGESASSVPSLIFFFLNIYKFSTEPCVISHLLITDFLRGWDADFSSISVNLEQLY